MIDAKEYYNSDSTAWSVRAAKVFYPDKEDSAQPSDEDCMICYSHIPGFSLVAKRWGWLLMIDSEVELLKIN